jgi:transcriptional regulator with XRE-family HTH domain
MEKHVTGRDLRELFSKNLKRLRTQMDISQLGLSVRAGLAHNYVNDIENSKKWPSPETIAKLAGALDVEPGDFFQSSPLQPSETEKIRTYLEEINEKFSCFVGEIKSVYLTAKKEKPSDNF